MLEKRVHQIDRHWNSLSVIASCDSINKPDRVFQGRCIQFRWRVAKKNGIKGIEFFRSKYFYKIAKYFFYDFFKKKNSKNSRTVFAVSFFLFFFSRTHSNKKCLLKCVTIYFACNPSIFFSNRERKIPKHVAA